MMKIKFMPHGGTPCPHKQKLPSGTTINVGMYFCADQCDYFVSKKDNEIECSYKPKTEDS